MTLLEYESMSLPHGLKAQFPESNEKGCRKKVIGTIHAVYSDGSITCYDTVNATPDKFKLLLRPLSGLTKPIEHKGEKFVPLQELLKNSNFNINKMSECDMLEFIEVYNVPELITLNDLPIYLKFHFDLAGLIEKGEAIDVNTLEENPYK